MADSANESPATPPVCAMPPAAADDAGAPWIACQDRLPPEGAVVETKIDDDGGVRNVRELVRKRRMWFSGDLAYVYYSPTHWRVAAPAKPAPPAHPVPADRDALALAGTLVSTAGRMVGAAQSVCTDAGQQERLADLRRSLHVIANELLREATRTSALPAAVNGKP